MSESLIAKIKNGLTPFEIVSEARYEIIPECQFMLIVNEIIKSQEELTALDDIAGALKCTWIVIKVIEEVSSNLLYFFY